MNLTFISWMTFACLLPIAWTLFGSLERWSDHQEAVKYLASGIGGPKTLADGHNNNALQYSLVCLNEQTPKY